MKLQLPFLLIIVVLIGNLCFVPSSGAQEEEAGRGIGLSAAPAGRYYALVIGNNAYQQLPKLKTAEEDARQVASLLREFYGFETKLLLNATRGQIVSALNVYRRELTADSNLLIYYAGHGINDKDADKAYWLPVDASREDTSNWIIADEITTSIKVIPAKHVLVVSDSCYSGTLTRGLGEMLPRPVEREQFLKKMALGRSRTLMASGGNEPVADGGGGRHSVFANALLRGLREMDKAQFTAAELFRAYVEESVAGRANQTPEYNPLRNSGHESGDFIFVKIKTDGRKMEVSVKVPTPLQTVDPAAFELEFWNAIKTSTEPADYKDYLAKYPNGQFAAIARRRANPPVETAKPVKPSPTPAPTPASESRPPTPSNRESDTPKQPNYVARCVFFQDPVSYFITANDEIIGVAPNGQALQVGRKIPPTVPGFIWMYSTPMITYGVDSEGKIWNRDPYGRPFQIGYVTKP
ncbi:MAG TPA: caspase family protein [Pyrinomonadaceae bacterium]|jgi:hypothetical protein